jgi:hypothetical protein
LNITVSGDQAQTTVDKVVAQIDRKFSGAGAGLGRSFSSVFDNASKSAKTFAAEVDRINSRLGIMDSRLASIGRNIRSLRMPSLADRNVASAMGAGGGADGLARDQERLARTLRFARMRGAAQYDKQYQADVLADQQRQYDALRDRATMLDRLERAGAADALRGRGFDAALQALGQPGTRQRHPVPRLPVGRRPERAPIHRRRTGRRAGPAAGGSGADVRRGLLRGHVRW